MRSSTWMRPFNESPPGTGTLAQRAVAPADAGPTGEFEDPASFQEELPLLREEQIKSREVDLLLIGFDLSEVGRVEPDPEGIVAPELRRVTFHFIGDPLVRGGR